MLPYLGATALVSRSGMSPLEQGVTLAAYCLVMLVPALVLLLLRLITRRLVEPILARVGAWMERTSGETTAWIVGIVGFLVARDAIARVPGAVELLGVSLG